MRDGSNIAAAFVREGVMPMSAVSGGCANAPPRDDIMIRLKGQDAALEALGQSLGVLSERLEPALRPVPPSAVCRSDGQSAAPPSPIAGAIEAHTARVLEMREAILSLVHRLDLP